MPRAGPPKPAAKVDILAVVEPQDFVQWGGVQAAIEEEQRLIEGIVAASVGEIMNAAGITPEIIVRQGDLVAAVRSHIGTREDVAALVLGAAPSGKPGPLVAHFTGNDARQATGPGDDHPGGLSDDQLEILS